MPDLLHVTSDFLREYKLKAVLLTVNLYFSILILPVDRPVEIE
jgi:hypothetical protein